MPPNNQPQPATVREPARALPLENGLHTLFSTSVEPTFLIHNNLIADCNPAAIAMMRATKSDIVSKHLASFSPPAQPDRRSSYEKAEQMIADAVANGSNRFEWELLRSDQSVVPVEFSLTSIPVDGKQIVYAVCRDVSERKHAETDRSKAEEALLTQTEILKSILKHMGDGVIVADCDERFLVFNPAAERMFGRGATQGVSEDWSAQYGLYMPDRETMFPPERLPLTRAIRGEEVDDVEVFVRHEDGPEGIWTRISGRPLRDGNGKLRGGVVVCRDITSSKKEDEFRAGQSRILEMIPSGAPLSSVLEELVLLIEAQAEEMFCSILLLSDDGAHVRHGAAPSLPQHYVAAVNGAPIGPKNGSCGTAMFRGEPVFVTDIFEDPLWEDYRELAAASGLRACWSTPIFSGEDKVLGSFAMYYQDPRIPTGMESRLTEVATHIAGIAIEHQRAQESLRRTQAELAHVSRVTTMGELAASIAHEVNQPLGAIVGNADICLHWLASDDPDMQQLREALRDIADDGRRASEVISRIRGLVKKNVPQKAKLDVNEVAGEVREIVEHEAQRRGVQLNLNVGAKEARVFGDRVQLQQVLLNLLMNGIEAMGGVDRSMRQLTITTGQDKDLDNRATVTISVRDSGVGLKPDETEQVFKAFHTTKSNGMGMGLAISRSIIEAHGGRLWAEPNDGPGATFKIALPVSNGSS